MYYIQSHLFFQIRNGV